MLKTEDLYLPTQAAENRDVPPALLPSAPRRVLLVTERGKDAALTLAGYRLNFGHVYQVRVSEPVADVQLVGFPSPLIRKQDGPREATSRGERYRCLSFGVQGMSWWNRLTQHQVYPHELEVEATMEDGRKVSLRLPILIQVSFTWGLVMLLVVWTMISFTLDVIKDAFWKQNLALFTSAWPWLWGLVLALIYPICVLARRTHSLWNRAQELQQEFDDRWGSPS